MIEWIVANKEWVFSGAGVALIGCVIGFLVVRKKHVTKQSIISKNADDINQVNINNGR